MEDFNTAQGGFDFGDSNFEQDVYAVFDMSGFPNVSAEDVAVRLRCRGVYAIRVWRKAISVWEQILDADIVEELRQHATIRPMSVEKMAMVLGEEETELGYEVKDAITSLANAMRSNVKEAA
mgnify:CR=1 FL=1